MLEYLKLNVKFSTNSPLFEEKEGKYKNCNCYCYTLGITAPDIFAKTFEYKKIDDFCHNIGFMTNEIHSSNDLDDI